MFCIHCSDGVVLMHQGHDIMRCMLIKIVNGALMYELWFSGCAHVYVTGHRKRVHSTQNYYLEI